MFPWTLNDISVQLKCKIVDKFEILKRHEEDLGIIKKEMIQYLKFYKNVISELKSQIKDLEAYLVQEISSSHAESRIPSMEENVDKVYILSYILSQLYLHRMVLDTLAPVCIQEKYFILICQRDLLV